MQKVHKKNNQNNARNNNATEKKPSNEITRCKTASNKVLNRLKRQKNLGVIGLKYRL